MSTATEKMTRFKEEKKRERKNEETCGRTPVQGEKVGREVA